MILPSKKKRIIKSLGMLAALLALLFALAACGLGRGGTDSNINDSIITEFIYLPQRIEMPTMPDQTEIQGTVVHGDRIFYYFLDHNVDQDFPETEEEWETWVPNPPNIVIANMLADGTDQRQFTLPAAASNVNIAGAHVTQAGNLALLVVNEDWDRMRGTSDVRLFYKEYDLQGNEIVNRELQGIIPPGQNWFQVDRVLFAEDGHLVFTAWADRGMEVFLLDSDLALISQLEMESGAQGITQLGDGRVVIMDWEGDGNIEDRVSVLREIDLEAGDWGETMSFTVGSVRSFFPPRDGDSFDLIIDDGNHLFGYSLDTGERTLLLNWIEAELTASWGYHVGFLDDGRISVLASEWDWGSGGRGDGVVNTELLTLTRTSRAELPERAVITLGGSWFSGDIRTQIIEFNRTSQTHQIQVRDYSIYNTSDDWRRGNLRLMTELATGDGPDIVWGWHDGAQTNRGMFADLYAFIDADPVLNRSDFFPNILAAMEAADGTLPMISNSFGIETMVGMTDAVGHIQSWTTADMLALLEETDDANMEYIMGQWLTGESFLTTVLMFSGREYIDWDEGQANLNSDAFIQLLEIAARLPAQRDEDGNFRREDFVSDYTRMRRGQQLLYTAGIWSQSRYSELGAALGGEFTVLGMPTQGGGAHVIHPGESFGINAASDHQDEAWAFIRQFFLPDARVEWSIPLRIDLYDEAIAQAMEPFGVWIDEDGNEWPSGGGSWSVDNYLTIEMAPMTEQEAMELRTIVESASLVGRFDETVREMIQEELLPFLAGDTTAADTARVLQNRIQTYLNERR